MKECIIVGGGLCGLATAYLLKLKGITATIIEAQAQCGGRIKTIYSPDRQTPMEMGATWFGNQHQNLVQFLAALKIPHFNQATQGITLFETMSFVPPQQFTIPASEEPYFRLKNGTEILIKTLVEYVRHHNIILEEKVVNIAEISDEKICVETNKDIYYTQKVIIAAPPQVVVKHINFSPELPAEYYKTMPKTQTWMAESVKFAIEYHTPFWRDKGFSGTVYSQVGLITEMYEHANHQDTGFALMGFLGGSAIQYSKEERESKVVQQLEKLFGAGARNFTFYEDSCWANEPLVHVPSPHVISPHQNNGHPLYAQTIWSDKLFFAGTETSAVYGGYMEGAIYAAKRVAASF
jgi:monoamine oxidase